MSQQLWPVAARFELTSRARLLEVDPAHMPRAMDLEDLHAELAAAPMAGFAGVTRFVDGRLVLSFRQTPARSARAIALARVRAHVPRLLQPDPIAEGVL